MSTADKREVHRLRAENARQREQIEGLVAQVSQMGEMLARANEQLAELLAIAQRKKRPPPRRAKPPAAPPTLSEAQREAYENRPKAPPLPKKQKGPKKPHKPTGRGVLPEHLPAEEHEVRPSECPDCGCDEFEWVGQVIETKLHVIKEHQRRRVVHRKTGCCKHCGTRTTARSLPSPFARSKATCEWLGWYLHQRFAMLLPIDRLARDLAAKGVPAAKSYLVKQVERCADLLAPVDGEHWKQLLRGTWMATDATGLKVLVPNIPGSHHGHIEVYRRDDLVVFQYEADKRGEPLASKLGRFKGILVADAEHRHNAVFDSGDVLEAGCNAHGRRKFRDAEAVQPALAVEGGQHIAAMYVAESEARAKGLTGDALLAWRQTRIAPLRDELQAWMDGVEPLLLPDDPLAKVIRYYRNHWEALFRFVDHPDIPIDNSASEREFQNLAKFRLNCLFAGSTEGAHRTAILLGLVATCRALGLDSQAYFSWALTRLGTHKELYGLGVADLTPAAFKRASANQ